METGIETIRENISRWNTIRTTNDALTYLTSGFGFEISRDEYIEWERIIPESQRSDVMIHMYIGITHSEVTGGLEAIFYLVDAITDEAAADGDEAYRPGVNLFQKTFPKELIQPGGLGLPQIPIPRLKLKLGPDKESLETVEAVERSYRWFLYANDWFYNKQVTNPEDVVQVFDIPFSDFAEVFKESDSTHAFLFFGLTDITSDGSTYENEIEILVCSKRDLSSTKSNEMELRVFQDVSLPKPPWTADTNKYNLITL